MEKSRVSFRISSAVIFCLWASSVSAFTVTGTVKDSATSYCPNGATIKAFDVDPLPGGSFSVDSAPLASATINATGGFSLTFAWPVAGTGYEVGGPDLIFRVEQNIGGNVISIFEEKPVQTHWNVANGASFNFLIKMASAILTDPSSSLDSIPNNKLFLFTRIGCIPTANINCRGDLAGANGYAYPRASCTSGDCSNTDEPFGGALDMFGWFGKNCQLSYYKAQYSSDAGVTWKDIETSLSNYWFDTSDPNPLYWHWVAQSMGPFSDGGYSNLYVIPFFVRPNTPWAWLDRVASFNTTVAANGINRVRIKGYKKIGTTVSEATSADFTVVPGYGEIALQIDNTPPSVGIIDFKLNNIHKDVCEILNFGSTANDSITVYFRAYDARGHLHSYSLAAMYGHNSVVTPQPSAPQKAYDTYNAHGGTSPTWNGALDLQTSYKGNVYASTQMPTCAYQFRLDVAKRTTNGYGLIYCGIEDTYHVTIQR